MNACNKQSCNHFTLSGKLIRINIYGKNNSAANLIIGMQNGDDSAKSVKFFNKDIIAKLQPDMDIIVNGHIGSNSYRDSKGVIHYRDNNDLIADTVTIVKSELKTENDDLQKALAAIYG